VDDILTEAEIIALTGKTRHRAQARVLAELGIRATPRPGRDGSLIVLRKHRNAALGLRDNLRHVEQSAAPDFAALDA
jgi:hypothetical protein